MKKSLILMSALAALTACNSKPQGETNGVATESTKSLIIYYSQSGATQQVAQLIQQKTGADIEAIVCEQPYDGDFQQTIERVQQDMSQSIVPDIQELAHPVTDYDTIYVGYPIWFGTYAPPISRLLSQNNFNQKVVIPFCTFGSGGLENSEWELRETLEESTVLAGYGVRNARVEKASSELDRWLVEIGVLEGQVQDLPDFGEEHAVSEAEAAIFSEACSSYQMPLGNPVNVAVRELDDAVEYRFMADNNSQVYVLKDKAEGSVAEFTRVVRD